MIGKPDDGRTISWRWLGGLFATVTLGWASLLTHMVLADRERVVALEERTRATATLIEAVSSQAVEVPARLRGLEVMMSNLTETMKEHIRATKHTSAGPDMGGPDK